MTKKKNQSAVVVSETQSLTPAPDASSAEGLIALAINKGVPIDTMERLLAMRRELKAEKAKEEFDEAMAGFQGECPVIEKKKVAKDDGKVLYKYAPLDDIIDQVKDLLQKYGFSYAFRTDNLPESVNVVCIAKHRGGHSEESPMKTALATRTKIMSSPQQTASTVTFNKRYAFCNAFGIMTGDEDVDASPASIPKEAPVHATAKVVEGEVVGITGPTLAQLKHLHTLITKYGMPPEEFKKAYKIESSKDLTLDQCTKAIDGLKKRVDEGRNWANDQKQAQKANNEAVKTPGSETKSTDVKAPVESAAAAEVVKPAMNKAQQIIEWGKKIRAATESELSDIEGIVRLDSGLDSTVKMTVVGLIENRKKEIKEINQVGEDAFKKSEKPV